MNRRLKICFLFLVLAGLLLPAGAFAGVDSVWGTDSDFLGRDNHGNAGGTMPGVLTAADWAAGKAVANDKFQAALPAGTTGSFDMFFNSDDVFTAMNGQAGENNVTEADILAVQATYDGDIDMLTEEIKGAWSPKGGKYLTGLFSFTAEVSPANPVLVQIETPAIMIPGVEGKKAGNLTAVKLKYDGTTKKFSYDAEAADGNFCLTSGGECVAKDVELSGEAAYGVRAYIMDNGDYDSDDTVGVISDPFAIATDDDDDDGGCVFNPAAGLTLEWLLVLIAPALMIIRRRFQ